MMVGGKFEPICDDPVDNVVCHQGAVNGDVLVCAEGLGRSVRVCCQSIKRKLAVHDSMDPMRSDEVSVNNKRRPDHHVVHILQQ